MNVRMLRALFVKYQPHERKRVYAERHIHQSVRCHEAVHIVLEHKYNGIAGVLGVREQSGERGGNVGNA